MRVFKRPGPINTSEIVNIVGEKSDLVNCIVVASITGESAIKRRNKRGDWFTLRQKFQIIPCFSRNLSRGTEWVWKPHTL